MCALPAHADESTAVDPTPLPATVVPSDPIIVPLPLGGKAPWPGLLLNAPAVARIKVELDTAKEQCVIITQKAVNTQKAQYEFQLESERATAERKETEAAASLKSRNSEIQDLQKALDKAEKDRPNVYLWTGLGVVGGAVLTVLTVFAVTRATN